MRFHVLNTSRSPHTEGLRAACPEKIGLMFRLRGQPIYHRTARWITVEDLIEDVERVCFGVRYGIIEVRFDSPIGDPLTEEALRDVVSKVQALKVKVVKGKAKDISGAFDHLKPKPANKAAPVENKTKKKVEPKPEPPKPEPEPEPEPEPDPEPEEEVVPEPEPPAIPPKSEMTISEIKDLLDAQGIEYKASLNKAKLYKLLTAGPKDGNE